MENIRFILDIKNLPPFHTREKIIYSLIMIDTELKFLENDIAEVINLFVDKDNVDLKHRFSEKENK